MILNIPLQKNKIILALGAESAGNFSVYSNKAIYLSEDFGDLLDDKNFKKYKATLEIFLRKNQLRPNIVLTDLHPNYITTILGKNLAKKFKADYLQIQHHLAHIFSQIGNNFIQNNKIQTPNTIYGLALDGTGYGTDGKIWGGEVFKISSLKMQTTRIGHLENQIMIGGELAIKEPARILISILSNFQKKESIYSYVKKYYTKNQFELLFNQLEQNFNCIETSSTGRILDAISVLLGFAKNQRTYKHEATHLLEKNSTIPYKDFRPKIIKKSKTKLILDTTYILKYILKYIPGNVNGNIPRDPKRLAATAQIYIIQGLEEIVKNYALKTVHQKKNSKNKQQLILSGGISNNKIISNYFNKKKSNDSTEALDSIIPRGDAGISLGQIIFWLLNN